MIEREGDGQVLIAQRPAHKHLALKWEFPGGKIEPGEAPSAALMREIAEELGCVIEIVATLPTSRHDYGPLRIAMVPLRARLRPDSPPPAAREHVALHWVPPAELLRYDLAAADVPIVSDYLRRLAAAPSGEQETT